MTKGRITLGGFGAVAVTLAALAECCTSRDKTSPARPADVATAPGAAERQGLQSVSLPDLSQMAPSAQTQVRERYASVMRRIENRASAPVELADSYGELGKILMAADHRDAAEPCFLNAQTLAPIDFR